MAVPTSSIEDAGVERVVAPWMQHLQSGRLAGVVQIAGSSQKWIRLVLSGGAGPLTTTRAVFSGARLLRESESEEESEGESSADDTAQAATRPDPNHSAAEWLLLVEALARVDLGLVVRVLKGVPRTGALAAALVEKEWTDGGSIRFVLDGLASDVSAVLALLTRDSDSLSKEFKQAKDLVLAGQKPAKAGGSHRPAIVLRAKVERPRKSAPGDSAYLDTLALALRNWDRWKNSQLPEVSAPSIVLSAVDIRIEGFQTLEWLAQRFPKESTVRIGQLTCSGDLGSVESLEVALRQLLHGIGESAPPPRVQSLVLKHPVDAETLRVFCSAVRTTQSLRSFTVDSVLQEYGREPQARTRRWQHFADAIFSHHATHNIQRIVINEWTLLPDDVRAVAEAIAADGAEHTDALSRELPSDLKIASLHLSASGILGGSVAPLTDLLRVLLARLSRLTDLSLSVSDDPLMNDAVLLAAVEGFVPRLRSLSLKGVELDSLASLLSTRSDSQLRLESLQLQNLFVGDVESYASFFRLLGDPANPKTRHLDTLRIGLSKRHSLEDVRNVLSLVESMLQANPRILYCKINCHCDDSNAIGSLEKSLNSIHDQAAIAPVRLTSRAAFLSVFETMFGNSPMQKRQRNHHYQASTSLPRPHLDGFALIFSFAARATKRVASVSVGRVQD